MGNFYSWMQLSILSSIVLRLGSDIFALKIGYSCGLNQIFKIYLKELKNKITIVCITIILSVIYLCIYCVNDNIIEFLTFVFLFIINSLISEYLRSSGFQLLPLFVQNLVIPLGLILCGKYFDLYNIVYISQILSLFLQLGFYSFYFKSEGVNSKLDTSEVSYFNKNNIINSLVSYSDIIVISVFCGSDDVVYYYIASRIANICNIFLGVVNGIIAPLYSKLWMNNKKMKLIQLFKKNLYFMFFIGIIYITSIYVFGEKLILFFYNKNFSDTVYYLNILSVGVVFTLLTGTSGYFLMMTNETVLYNNIILKIGVFSLLLLLVFGYYYEVEGVAFIVSLSFIMKNAITFYFAVRKLKTL